MNSTCTPQHLHRLLVVLTAGVLLAAPASCIRGHGDSPRPYDNDSTTLTNVAWRMHDHGAPIDSCIEVQQRAADLVHSGQSREDPVMVLEQLGLFESIRGKYTLSMRHYLEALDSLRGRRNDRSGIGAVKLYGDIALLWHRLGKSDLALAYADTALALSARTGGAFQCDLHLFRAEFFDVLGMTDSAINAYDRAIAVIDTYDPNGSPAELRAWARAEKAGYMIRQFPERRDTVAMAVEMIERSLDSIAPDSETSLVKLDLGHGLCLIGQTRRGLPVMEQATEQLRRQGDIADYDMALRTLCNVYSSLGMSRKLADIYPEVKFVTDTMRALIKDETRSGVEAYHMIKEAELENEILRSHLRETRVRALAIIAASLLGLIVMAVLWRGVRRRYRHLQTQTSEITEHNKLLRHENESLRTSQTDVLYNPELFTDVGTGQFKRVFQATYPDFCRALHTRYASLTPSEELLCMLIYLDYNAEETTSLLGISKASLNTARYRLRKKFAVDKNVNLNEFIKLIK